jgi:hypothetical protein
VFEDIVSGSTHSRHVARLVWLVLRATLVELSPRRHCDAIIHPQGAKYLRPRFHQQL